MTIVFPEFKVLALVSLRGTSEMNKIKKSDGKGRLSGNEKIVNGGLVV